MNNITMNNIYKDSIKNIVITLENYTDINSQKYLSDFSINTIHFSLEQWDELWNQLKESSNESMKIIFLWECLNHDLKNEKLEYYTQLLYNTTSLSWAQKYFIEYQIESLLFNNSNLGTKHITELLYMNYHNILHSFMSNLNNLTVINNRNNDLIFITIQQFLSLNHGPTKTILDRALILKTEFNKNIVIINTAEFLGTPCINLLTCVQANYNEQYLNIDSYEYGGETFPFVQFDNNMPNIYNSQEFINFVRHNKPAYIINIGSESLLMDACSKIVPVLDITTVPSDIAKTEATALAIGRDIKPDDEHLLNLIEKSTDYIIKGRFTSSLKPQTCSYTRKDFNLPTDRFIIAIVGGRLTNEVDQQFINMIDICFSYGAHLCIIGNMETYDKICEEDNIFKNHSTYLGFQKDILAILEICDLYVNPKRKGGGTSVIEAMYKSLPAISINYGDVALGAGEDFCVNNYAEMSETITKYITDKSFYNEMSIKAKSRADYMLDSKSAFVDIVNEFCTRFVDNMNS